MKILGLDTSAAACSVGILADQSITVQHTIAPMQQAKIILPMIEAVLSQASLSLKELDAITFGCGPGSFTGVRIAASVAQGLAFAANLPVIPISSLALLAQTALLEKKGENFAIAMDARMNEIYWAEYQVNLKGMVELVGEEKICSLADLHSLNVTNKSIVAIGDAWERFKTELIQNLHFEPQAIHSTIIPHAEPLLQLAKEQYQNGKYVTASMALPNYLR